MTWALEMYLATKRTAKALGPLDPFPLVGRNPFLRLLGQAVPQWQGGPPARELVALEDEPPPRAPSPPPRETTTAGEVAELRREVEALKKSVKRRKR